jgi:parallel beta-helix repeat protein
MAAGACAGAAPVKHHAGVPRPVASLVCTAVPRPGVAVYAAPRGTTVGAGTIDAPWDLATALSCAAEGDTVWLRGGLYSGFFATALRGTAAAPIVFRQYPGERATIDGTLRADGAYLVFWGFEIMQSAPSTYALQANTSFGRFINLVIHDAGNQGISFWTPGENAELYGCIVYNNGTHENLDHGVYVHNVLGTKVLADNVFFDNFARGIQVYASHNNELVRNVRIRGNIAFDNGAISTRVGARQNLVVNAQVPISGMEVLDNLLYYAPGEGGVQLRLGNVDPSFNGDIAVDSNYAVGGASGLEMRLQWAKAEVQHNVFVGGTTTTMVSTGGNDAGYRWSGNVYYRDSAAVAWRHNDADFDFARWRSTTGLGASDRVIAGAPTTAKVVVRPNKYEDGRAFVVVYNFGLQPVVDVDLSGVLKPGSRFAIHNVQDVFGDPVDSGSYAGGLVAIPMTGVEPPVPLGRPTRQAPKTGPAFDVFLVTSTSGERSP